MDGEFICHPCRDCYANPEELRARCPSIFSSIEIELNVLRDDFSLIAIELSFVTLGYGFN